MNLFELFDPPIAGLQSIDDDNSKPAWKSSRKTKLTLSQLRRLRRMMDVRAYERTLHLGKVKDQYGTSDDSAAPPM